eukprot:606656-Prorocentrum_minimum.AAC.2
MFRVGICMVAVLVVGIWSYDILALTGYQSPPSLSGSTETAASVSALLVRVAELESKVAALHRTERVLGFTHRKIELLENRAAQTDSKKLQVGQSAQVQETQYPISPESEEESLPTWLPVGSDLQTRRNAQEHAVLAHAPVHTKKFGDQQLHWGGFEVR